MKARIRRLSASVDSPTIVIDQSSTTNPEEGSSRVSSDGSSPSELSRIDRMKKLLSSPLNRRKSSTSSAPSALSSVASPRTFGASLTSLAFNEGCSSCSQSSLLAPNMTGSFPVPGNSSNTSAITASLSVDIPVTEHQHSMATLAPTASFDTSSLSPSPPIMPPSFHPMASNIVSVKQPGIPFIITRLCNFIEANSGLAHEGLFRVSGNVKLVEKLKNSFDTFGDAPLETIGDVPSAAALIKLFLRELHDPVIPTHMSRKFLEIIKDPTSLSTNQQKSLEKLKKLIDNNLPPENYYILKYLCSFLYQVALNESRNRMNCSSLGIVFGPNFFRLSTDDYKELKDQAISGPNILVSTFIAHHEMLFSSCHHPLGSTSGYTPQVTPSNLLPDDGSIHFLSSSLPSGSMSVTDEASYALLQGCANTSSMLEKSSELLAPKSGHVKNKNKKKKSTSFDTHMTSCPLEPGSSSGDICDPKKKGIPSKYSLPRIIPLLTLSKTDQGTSTSVLGSATRTRFGRKRKDRSGSSSSPSSNFTSTGVEDDDELTPKNLSVMMLAMQPPLHGILRSCSEERASPEPGSNAHLIVQRDNSSIRRCKSSEAVLKLCSYSTESPPSPSSSQTRSIGSLELLDEGADDVVEAGKFFDEAIPMQSLTNPQLEQCAKEILGGLITSLKSESVQELLTGDSLGGIASRPSSSHGIVSGSKSISPESMSKKSPSIDDVTSSHDSLASCSLLSEDPFAVCHGRRKSSDEILGMKRKNSLKSQGVETSSPSFASDVILRPSSIDRTKRMEAIKKCSEKLPDLVLVCPKKEQNNNVQEQEIEVRITEVDDEIDSPIEQSSVKGRLPGGPLVDIKNLVDPSAIPCSSLDIIHRNSWPGALLDRHSPVKELENPRGRDSIDSTASGDSCNVLTVNNSYPLTNLVVNQLKMSENNPYEAPTSPSAFRAYLAQRSKRLSDPSSAPSPPIDHQFDQQQQFGSSGSRYCTSAQIVKEAKRRISCLKRDLKDFDLTYEKKFGARPSYEQKIKSPVAKPLLLELGKLRKGLKEMKEDHSIRRDLLDIDPSFPSSSSGKVIVGDEYLSTTSSTSPCPYLSSRSHHKTKPLVGRRLLRDDIDFLPPKMQSDPSIKVDSDLLVESLNEMQTSLQSKRLISGRPEDFDSMSPEQVMDEKLDLQKALLKFESTYGRPATKKERDVMRPVYDRYRLVKRMVARMPKSLVATANAAGTSGSESDLQPILENVVMSFESMAMTNSTNTAPSTTNAPITANTSTSGVLEARSVDTKCASSFHELSLVELRNEMKDIRDEKKKLRKVIKSYEEEFSRKSGRKFEKEDRGEHIQSVYKEYKHLKGKLRLVEALVLKREKGQHQL